MNAESGLKTIGLGEFRLHAMSAQCLQQTVRPTRQILGCNHASKAHVLLRVVKRLFRVVKCTHSGNSLLGATQDAN